MRLLLDTCVIIDWLTDPHSIGDEVWDIINEPGCKLYVSAETVRELIVSFKWLFSWSITDILPLSR